MDNVTGLFCVRGMTDRRKLLAYLGNSLLIVVRFFV